MKKKRKLNDIIREDLLEPYYWFKLYTGRAHQYINLPLDLMKDFFIAMTFLKVYYPNMSYVWFIPLFFILFVFLFFIGRWDVKNKNALREHDINNTVNPWNDKLKEIKRELKKR